MSRNEKQARYGYDILAAQSRAMQALMDKIRKCAASSSAVFITGETGTGKSLVAKVIHYNSPRKDKPFVVINCAALTPDQVDRIFYGDDFYNQAGKFEEAAGGTVFLEEVGQLTPIAQYKLLQILEEGYLERRPGGRRVPADFRLISSSSDLPNILEKVNFQRDLFFRLNTLPIRVPSLKERIEDIPYMANLFLEEFCARERIPQPVIPFHYIELLMQVAWNGNARQLRNHIESVMVLSDGEFDPEIIHAQFHVERAGDPSSFLKGLYEKIFRGEPVRLDSVLGEIEYALVKKSLEATDGNQSRAAKIVGLNEQKIRRVMTKHGLKLKRQKGKR
jgi:two-component system NtrC family response regulator